MEPNHPHSHTSRNFLQYAAAALFVIMAITMLKVGVFSPWFKNIRAEITQQPYSRTITVSAEGKISAKPDLAKVNLTVVSEKATVKEVTADNNAKMNAVLDAVKKLGIESKDITTSAYNLYPQYRYQDFRSPQITGYSLSQELTIKIRNLELVDDVLDTATKLGVNQVGQLTFDIDDAGGLKSEAREKAFDTAREKAEQMASAAGVKLGRVVTFSESSDMFYPQPYQNFSYEKAMVSDAAPAPAIEPGSKELNVNVSVTYEID